jgi:hypothetical protein
MFKAAPVTSGYLAETKPGVFLTMANALTQRWRIEARFRRRRLLKLSLLHARSRLLPYWHDVFANDQRPTTVSLTTED